MDTCPICKAIITAEDVNPDDVNNADEGDKPAE